MEHLKMLGLLYYYMRFVRNILHKYNSRHFKIVSNFTRLTAREISIIRITISKYHSWYLCQRISLQIMLLHLAVVSGGVRVY